MLEWNFYLDVKTPGPSGVTETVPVSCHQRESLNWITQGGGSSDEHCFAYLISFTFSTLSAWGFSLPTNRNPRINAATKKTKTSCSRDAWTSSHRFWETRDSTVTAFPPQRHTWRSTIGHWMSCRISFLGHLPTRFWRVTGLEIAVFCKMCEVAFLLEGLCIDELFCLVSPVGSGKHGITGDVWNGYGKKWGNQIKSISILLIVFHVAGRCTITELFSM